MKKFIIVITAFCLMCSCKKKPLVDDVIVDKPSPPTSIPYVDQLIKITKFEGASFVDANGKPFFPWGLNYTHTEEVGFIEDNWADVSIWDIIESDFDEMKALTANIVRIHLQYHYFMLDSITPNEANLDKLLSFVEMADRKGLYLKITGLASYRKDDDPQWYRDMNDAQRWSTQKIFWKSVAKKVGHKGAVFAFDLMNEPAVSAGCAVVDQCDWLVNSPFGGFYFIQNISRDPASKYTPTLKKWMLEMTTAIRSVDSSTMITTGLLPSLGLYQYADDLDFVSIHQYPTTGQINQAASYFKANSTQGFILSETFTLSCTLPELEDYLDQIEGYYFGLMGHYNGDTIEELDAKQTTAANIWKDFLEMFVRRNPN